MKNKRKSLIGLGLIMALSVYAGAATTSNLKNSKGNTETMIENTQKEFDKDKCPMPPGHPGHEAWNIKTIWGVGYKFDIHE